MFQQTLFFSQDKLQDHVNGFLFCIVDESAGIDDRSIDVAGSVGIEDEAVAIRLKLRREQFGIDQILRTAQRYQTDPVGRSLCFQGWMFN